MPRPKSNVETKEPATILAEVSSEKAFHFYRDLGVPTGLVARSLKELLTILQTVEAKSIEFHVLRGDFEKWVKMLGDRSLERQIAKLRKLDAKNEILRKRLVEMLTKRYETLKSSA